MKRFGKVTVALATFPERLKYAVKVLETMWPQCDYLKICLNEFTYEPSEIRAFRRKIDSEITDDHTFECILANGKNGVPDLGCDNKMRWVDGCDGYYITVDDDIGYPDNYVEKLIEGIDKYNGDAVCSFHGKIFSTIDGKINFNDNFKAFELFFKETKNDMQVHTIGMGVGGCVPKKLNLTFSMFSSQGKNAGDDEIMAVYCARNNIPMYVLAKKENYLLHLRVPGYRMSSDKQSRAERNKNILGSFDQWPKLPKLKRESLSITYITDGNEVIGKYLVTSMLSVIVNSEINVSFNVIYKDVSDKLLACFSTISKYYGVQINTIKLSSELYEKCLKYNKETIAKGRASATSIALVKFDLPELLKENFTLFLDNDTLCNGSLKELYDISKSGTDTLMYAVKHEGMEKFRNNWRHLKYHPYHAHEDYINSGVLLINLEEWRKQGISESLWNAKENCLDNFLVDQNAFNMVFHNRMRLVDSKYNACSGKTDDPNVSILHYYGRGNKPLTDENAPHKDLWLRFFKEISNILNRVNDGEKSVSNELSKPKVCKISEENVITQSNRNLHENIENDAGKAVGNEKKSDEISETEVLTDFDFQFGLNNIKHDVVFILGEGSKNCDAELFFAFSSLMKFCRSWVRNIYVVGSKPRCSLDKFIYTYIPCDDIYRNKDANIIHKIRYAIENIPDLSDNFLKCSDDQLVTKPCSWDDFKPMYLKQFSASDTNFYLTCHRKPYNQWLCNLYETLYRFKDSKYPVYYYQPHVWSPINKNSFLRMCEEIDYSRESNIILFSLYYNYIHYANPRKCQDHVFYAFQMLDWAKEFRAHDYKYIGYNDDAFSMKFRSELVKIVKFTGSYYEDIDQN